MRKSGQKGRSRWPIALVISAALHGLAVFGLWHAPFGRAVQPEPEGPTAAQLNFILNDEDGGGEISFVPRVEPKQARSAVAKIENPSLPLLPVSGGNLNHPFHDPVSTGSDGSASGQGGAGNGGGVKGASFFAVPAQGKRIAFVIDGSGSMGKNGAWAAARAELIRALRTLPVECRFQVIVYNDGARPLLPSQPGWLEPTPAGVQRVAQALAELPVEGKTDHAQGLQAGLRQEPDVMFFLTDADDLTPEHLRLVQRFNAEGRTAIHTIELTTRNRHRPDMPMQQLAQIYGGVYQAVDLAASGQVP